MEKNKFKFYIPYVILNFLILLFLVFLTYNLTKEDFLIYPSIIHFDKLRGIFFLGDKTDVLYFNSLIISFIIINNFLAIKIENKDKLTFYIIFSLNVLLFIILILFNLKLIYNN